LNRQAAPPACFRGLRFSFKPPNLQDMRAVMGGATEGGAALAIHKVATVEDFDILRRIDIVSVKVWLLRRWRLAQGFFLRADHVRRDNEHFRLWLGENG
jgi:hypothetical protein